jgi:hypothetical protein
MGAIENIVGLLELSKYPPILGGVDD